MSRLRRRMATTLAALTVLDIVVAVVLAALTVPWVRPAVDALTRTAGLPRLPAAVVLVGLMPIAALALAVLALSVARHRLLDDLDATPATEGSHPALLDRVRRLAAQADVPVPAVVIVDSPVPNSALVGGIGGGTLLVSTGLIDALDGDALDGVLAHELAHRQNRDAVVMTVVSLVPALVDDRRVLPDLTSRRWPWLVAGGLGLALTAALVDAPLVSPTTLGAFVVLTTLTIVLGSVLLGVLAVPVTVLARRLARDRELAADRAAALLTGDPAALALALERLDDRADRPTTDRRADGVAALCLLARGFGDESDRDGLGSDPAFTIETHSHPPTERRIEHLREIAAELEQGGVDREAAV
ncbi:M48 family metallopeptidase [Halococcoides cellulosivorans]|uniref:Peptidase M48 domain-containing protein n=1 Tax=Halococcoides cellulosivorans TaxID=1679096 RepID=A0A2R4X2I9_9EURY|nr:M48 family metalloprotease [Halococcoides cellulosivorans]AWB28008.1 hypothetical protein HARCEL1_09950 [Halococcoides cellulosivorans]